MCVVPSRERCRSIQRRTFPQLAGQHPVDILKQLTDIRAGARENPLVLPATAQLSEQDLADIASFLKILPIPAARGAANASSSRSEERRVGKECA